jgi:hypothetical protein
MKSNREITYALDLRKSRRDSDPQRSGCSPEPVGTNDAIPRIARLVALAMRFEDLVRERQIKDYAAIARAGHVTRARLTQIMRLRDLAPDIQERLLFMPRVKRVNERNLRPVTSRIDWAEQRAMFEKLCGIDLTVAPQRSDECPDRGESRGKGAHIDDHRNETSQPADRRRNSRTGRAPRAPQRPGEKGNQEENARARGAEKHQRRETQAEGKVRREARG